MVRLGREEGGAVPVVEMPPPSPPSRTLLEAVRPTEVLACNPYTDVSFGTTDLQVTYQVQTLHPLADLGSPLAQILPKLVLGAAVETVHLDTCSLGQEETVGFGSLAHNANTAVARLAECIYSISTAEYKELSYCQDTRVPNCIAFQGDLKIFHTVGCQEDLHRAGMLALERGSVQQAFVESINTFLPDYENKVQSVTVMGIPSAVNHGKEEIIPATTTTHESSTKLALGGFFALALASVLLCLVCGLVHVYYKSKYGYVEREIKCTRTLEDNDEEEGTCSTSDVHGLVGRDGSSGPAHGSNLKRSDLRFYDEEEYVARNQSVELALKTNSASSLLNHFWHKRRGPESVDFARASGTGIVSSDSEDEEQSVDSCDE